MKKLTLLFCVVILCLTFVVGCTQYSDVTPVTTVAPTTAAETTAPPTTVPKTTVPVTTAAPTTAAPKDEVVYTPIEYNKPSQEDNFDIYETVKPTKPVKPATGDEVQNPTADKRYKYIAFTFDDGPHWSLTYKFADKLAQYGGVGTFYVVGNRIHGEQANAMAYAHSLGNEIGVHGYTHEFYYSSCSDSKFKEELTKTADAIYKYTGEYPTTMRPPGGLITSSRVKSSGYAVINWNVDSADWQYVFNGQYGRDQIVNNVLRSVDEGDIILMHEIYEDSYKSFCVLADTLYKQGYRFVTVSQLLGLDESSVGKLYYGY